VQTASALPFSSNLPSSRVSEPTPLFLFLSLSSLFLSLSSHFLSFSLLLLSLSFFLFISPRSSLSLSLSFRLLQAATSWKMRKTQAIPLSSLSLLSLSPLSLFPISLSLSPLSLSISYLSLSLSWSEVVLAPSLLLVLYLT
jgi:hypothetical protein